MFYDRKKGKEIKESNLKLTKKKTHANSYAEKYNRFCIDRNDTFPKYD